MNWFNRIFKRNYKVSKIITPKYKVNDKVKTVVRKDNRGLMKGSVGTIIDVNLINETPMYQILFNNKNMDYFREYEICSWK